MQQPIEVLHAIQTPASDEISISGKVIDGDTGIPLAGVRVQLAGAESFGQVANTSGNFRWRSLAPGSYQLSLNLNGFNTLTTTVSLQTGEKLDLGDIT